MGAYSIGMNRPAAGLIGALLLCGSGAASAAVTGTVAAASEYMLRGIEGSDGPALQGGLDWTGDLGVYAGGWGSNTGGPAAAGGTEIDLYAGWTARIDTFTVDFGAVYYWYPEDEEDVGASYDYPEVYAKLGLGPFALQLYYADRFYGAANEAAADAAGRDADGLYVNLIATFPLSASVTLVAQLGHSSGDGVEVAWGDSYADYSLSLTKALDDDVTVSLGLYDTTLKEDEGLGTLAAGDDAAKLVIGVKKTFGL
jgi:uncharacterized protein (TIGR02001 family)